jgi:hypothetical protein
MIDVIENSKAPLCDYNLVDTSSGCIIGKAKLTKYEVNVKNYAFRLNRVNKEYELLTCEEDTSEHTKLILP